MIHANRPSQHQGHQGYNSPAILDSIWSFSPVIPPLRILPLSSQEGP